MAKVLATVRANMGATPLVCNNLATLFSVASPRAPIGMTWRGWLASRVGGIAALDEAGDSINIFE